MTPLCLLLAAACDEQDVEIVTPPSQASLLVLDGEQAQTIDLQAMPAEAAPDGTPAVRLSGVLSAVEAALDQRLCDFVAEDGFRTSSKGEGCEPLPCERTVDAFVVLSTRDLVWLPSLGIRGCYAPRTLARIEMSPR